MKPSEYTNALWCINIIGLEVFNGMQQLSECASVYSRHATFSPQRTVRVVTIARHAKNNVGQCPT